MNFKINVDVTVQFSVDFASRLAEVILSSGTEDKQMKAFAHMLERAMDGEEETEQQKEEREPRTNPA